MQNKKSPFTEVKAITKQRNYPSTNGLTKALSFEKSIKIDLISKRIWNFNAKKRKEATAYFNEKQSTNQNMDHKPNTNLTLYYEWVDD
jgi:hypothetical protein